MFYDRFSELCKKRGKSPAAVTREIGLNNSSSTAWKHGATPKGETLQKLANYFGVSVDYLLGVRQWLSPSPGRRVFLLMQSQKWSLEKLSEETRIPIEMIRKFALGEKVENGRECLERIANVLHTNPAYLMGWTGHRDDEMPYLDITEEMWRLSGNDPDAAHWLQQAMDDEKYQQEMDEAERQQTKDKSPVLFKVGDSYYGGALRIADVEEKSDSEFSITFQLDKDGMEVQELISLFEMLQSMPSRHGVSIDGLTQLAKMVQAVAEKDPVQEKAHTLQEILDLQEDDKT